MKDATDSCIRLYGTLHRRSANIETCPAEDKFHFVELHEARSCRAKLNLDGN